VISGTGFGTPSEREHGDAEWRPGDHQTWSSTSISITIPSGATTGPMLVYAAAGSNASNPVTFTVTTQPLPAGWLNQDVGQVGGSG